MSNRIFLSFGLLGIFLAVAATGDDPQHASVEPDAGEQQRILTAIRKFAENYVSNLPNFICEQVTEQFEAGKKPTHWHKGDTLTSKLVFNQGREERSLELVNDKPPRAGIKRWRTPLVTEGEFGVLLGSVFGSDTSASFSWNRWDVIDNKTVAVFNYSIDGQHSNLRLSLSDLATATVPYYGLVYADPSTGVVWRITNNATDIPADVQTKSISTSIDYGQIAIANSEYVLPIRATVRLRTDQGNIRNQMEFRNYRKFEAESSITYEPGATGRSETGKTAGPGTPPR